MIITQKPEVLELPQTIVLPKLEVWDLLMIKEEAITYQQMLEVKIDLLVDHKQIMASVQLLQMEELNLLHNQGEVTEELQEVLSLQGLSQLLTQVQTIEQQHQELGLIILIQQELLLLESIIINSLLLEVKVERQQELDEIRNSLGFNKYFVYIELTV